MHQQMFLEWFGQELAPRLLRNAACFTIGAYHLQEGCSITLQLDLANAVDFCQAGFRLRIINAHINQRAI